MHSISLTTILVNRETEIFCPGNSEVRQRPQAVAPAHLYPPSIGNSKRAAHMGRPQRVETAFFDTLRKFFEPLKSFKKLMIKNERNPSWVPLVTLFLPVAQVFPLFRQPHRAAIRRPG